MFAQDWLSLSPVLAAGGILAVVGCLLLGVVAAHPISSTTVVELIVAVVLCQGVVATVVSGDVGLGARMALANLIASALVTMRWWGPWISPPRTGEPVLVFHRGHFVRAGLRRCRLAEEDVLASLRAQGVEALRATDSVVACADGSINLLRSKDSGHPALRLVSSRDNPGTTVLPR
jgi:uncharacterized membrane protein YcaP (DUF421 family)